MSASRTRNENPETVADIAESAAALADADRDPTATPTKKLVWKAGTMNSGRIIDPENHGTSKVYEFMPNNNHTVDVDESDAAVIMSGPDKGEFRISTAR